MPGWLVGISSIRPLRGPDRRADDDAGQFETASKRIDAAKQARILAAETLAAGETRLRAMADYNIAVARGAPLRIRNLDDPSLLSRERN